MTADFQIDDCGFWIVDCRIVIVDFERARPIANPQSQSSIANHKIRNLPSALHNR
jgi:hypothetical protein